MTATAPTLNQTLLEQVVRHTGRRVRDLRVELVGGAVVLQGRAGSFHVKQLAQHGVRELLPDAPLRNTIVVEPLAGAGYDLVG